MNKRNKNKYLLTYQDSKNNLVQVEFKRKKDCENFIKNNNISDYSHCSNLRNYRRGLVINKKIEWAGKEYMTKRSIDLKEKRKKAKRKNSLKNK